MKFYLIHNPTSGESLKVYNAAYELWKTQWKKVFKENNVNIVPTAEEFLSQDIIALLYDEEKEEVMIMNSLKFFSMRQIATYETTYLLNYPKDAVDYIRQHETAMGILKLTINPAYKKQLIGAKVSVLLIHLSTRFGQLSVADITLGMCRLDLKVNHLLSASGFVNISEPFDLYNTPVQPMFILPDMVKTPLEHSELLQKLWNDRTEVNINKFYKQINTRLKQAA